jgi:hypothetical protein
MPETRSISLTVDEAARLLHVQPQTIRRRLRSGELEQAERIGEGGPAVRLVPAETWIRVEDASALLGVSPATVRSNISRGRLDGRREANGRWRVLLRSVLEDSRCKPEAIEILSGEQREELEINSNSRRPHSLRRAVYLRLSPEEADLLERGRDRHGTQRAAVVRGLLAIDRDDLEPDDGQELRAERDLFEEQLGRVRSAHRGLQERASSRMVDELYCHVCEGFVSIEDTEQLEREDGKVEIFHRKHGHRSGGRFRSDTVIARRAPITLDSAE